VNKASAFEMDALDSRIKELVAYARERDGEDRATLFRNLVDLFLTGKAPQINPTRGQLLDVLQALIPHVNAEGRRTACDLVANMSKPPMDLVIRLAQDRASLVSSLLTQVAFDDEDLIELIGKTGREHHQVIASREDLSANIWIALARAAPSAPPFDHQSTLALWSDDLGITQTKALSQKLTERQPAAPLATAIGDPEKAAQKRAQHETHEQPGSQGQKQGQKQAQKSATVTPLHPERPAGSTTGASATIRILRTDEDLIASRTDPRTNLRADQETQKSSQLTGEEVLLEAPNNISTETTVPHNDPKARTDKDAAPATQQVSSTETNDQSFAANFPDEAPLTQRQAQDPGPGGWAWISDRDGFITSVSPQGEQLLGTQFSSIGTSMLDLLALNTKLGHPVARAFQRRSGIHDAPIFLSDMEEKHQHWTLEATPFFSSCGGIFEGYEGVLTPVVPAAEEIPALEADDGSALFLDELTTRPAAQAQLRVMPASFSDQATIFQPTAQTKTTAITESVEMMLPVDALKPTQQALDAVAANIIAEKQDLPAQNGKTGQPSGTTQAKPHQGEARAAITDDDPLATAAAAVIKDVLAEALGHRNSTPAAPDDATLDTDASQQELPADKLTSEPAAQPFNADALTSKETAAHIAATFNLLEDALARLTEASKHAGDPHLRLQGEIAAACVRSLKEQLN